MSDGSCLHPHILAILVSPRLPEQPGCAVAVYVGTGVGTGRDRLATVDVGDLPADAGFRPSSMVTFFNHEGLRTDREEQRITLASGTTTS